jgi:hypothetical protein
VSVTGRELGVPPDNSVARVAAARPSPGAERAARRVRVAAPERRWQDPTFRRRRSGKGRNGGLFLARQQSDLALVQALFLVANLVVTGRAGRFGGSLVAQNLGANEHQQVLLLARTAARLEEIADQRNGAQARHAVLALGHRILHQAAEHDGAAVLDENGGLDGALVGGNIGGVRELGARRGILLLDFHLDGVAFADVRRHLQDGTHFLALNGLERAGRAVRARWSNCV